MIQFLNTPKNVHFADVSYILIVYRHRVQYLKFVDEKRFIQVNMFQNYKIIIFDYYYYSIIMIFYITILNSQQVLLYQIIGEGNFSHADPHTIMQRAKPHMENAKIIYILTLK